MASFDEIERRINHKESNENTSDRSRHYPALSQAEKLENELGDYVSRNGYKCIIQRNAHVITAKNFGGQTFDVICDTNGTYAIKHNDVPGFVKFDLVLRQGLQNVPEDEMKEYFIYWYRQSIRSMVR